MNEQGGEVIERRAVGEALNRLAFAAELLDEETVDAKACTSLAWTIRSLEGDVTMARLATLDGVSVPILAVIDDVTNGRMPPLLAELEANVPSGLLEVRRLKGLGPKKIRALWQELDITSIGELEYACRENRLVELKGFGKKTQESVLQQIAALRERAGFMRLDHALALAALLEHEIGAPAHVAGDLRRRTEVVGDVVLVTEAPSAVVRDALARTATKLGGGAEAESAGSEGSSAASSSAVSPSSAALPSSAAPRAEVPNGPGDVVRARVGATRVVVHANVAPSSLGTALVIATGSSAHVDALRARASERGVDLDALACAGEADVYAKLGVLFVEPERREAGVPLVPVAEGRKPPRLVTVEDLRGSLHNHTTASDGDASLRQMRDAAAAFGLAYFAVTDHSQSAVYAKGLATSSLSAQREEARALNAEGSSCTILCGVESDILKDGALDYPEPVLAALDLVVASVHSRFGQKGADLTARMVAAGKDRWSDIVGHPTGRLLLGRAPAEYDVSALLEVCAANGNAVELNANPARLDLNERHLAEAKERKIPISIAADAHAVDELEYLEFGVAIARRAGLTVDDVLNTRPLEDVRAWLRARRARAPAA